MPDDPKVKHGYGETAVANGLGGKMRYGTGEGQNTLHYYGGATPKVSPTAKKTRK
jgi:hypothetical protein